MLAFLLALGTAGAVVLYLYVVLSGGVEGGADREDVPPDGSGGA